MRLAFWKKRESEPRLGLEELPPIPGEHDLTAGLGGTGNLSNLGSAPPPLPAEEHLTKPEEVKPSFTVPPHLEPVQPTQQLPSHQIELISAKLDSLKASLDMINQRLENIERMGQSEQYRKRYNW